MDTFWKRRTFLKGLGLLGAGWTAKGWTAPMTAIPFSSSLTKISETRNLMGTFVTITLFHPSSDQAQDILGETFQRMEVMIQLFNRHDPGSAITYLNERGFLLNPPPELLRLLRKCRSIHEQTKGVFDVTIKPLLDLYEYEKEKGRLPSSASIGGAQSRVGFENLQIRTDQISFSREGMGITLDGIAKGTIVDDTVAYLRKEGIRHAMVDAGGDIRVFGGRGGDTPWRIAVYDPKGKPSRQEVILLREGAVATSGNYMVYFDRQKVHHHIISPQNGYSPPWAVSGTVIAPSAEMADALATSILLFTPEKGRAFIDGQERLAALLLTREGKKVYSNRWLRNNRAKDEGVHHV